MEQEVKKVDDNPNMHPNDLLPSYLEGSLSADEQDVVRRHIQQCQECSTELDSLAPVLKILSTEKEVFCPEPLALYEFIENGFDPDGTVASHVDRCALCRSEVAFYKEGPKRDLLPSQIKEALNRAYPKTSIARDSGFKKVLARIRDRLSSLSGFRGFALGAALAAILAVVLIYPQGSDNTFIGVSGVDWEDDIPVAKSVLSESGSDKKNAAEGIADSILRKKTQGSPDPGMVNPKVAAVVLFNGFKKPFPESIVADLYEALRPDHKLNKQFVFIPPLQLKNFLDKLRDENLSSTKALTKFYKESSITFALVLNVENQEGKFGLKTAVIDARNGKILVESFKNDIPGTELASAVENSWSLFENVKVELQPD